MQMRHSQKEWGQRIMPLAGYTAIWMISVLLFWIIPISDDPIAYSFLAFYLLLPVSTIVASFIIGLDKRWGWLKWVVPVFFGVMFMLAEYLTFSLANMLTNETINAPEFTMVLTGMVISFVAMGLGAFVQTHFRREK